jgi:anti-sigma regulatory factor (Ser/Thr protein kinase)
MDGSWTAMPRVATHTPAPASHAIATARSFTFQTMGKWGVTDRADDVAAVVTELLTNAIKHALPQAQHAAATLSPWPIKVGLLHPGSHVICAIADPSPELPELRAPDWQDESGRGLLVVSSLSDHWGCCPAPDEHGKVVWSAFATTARPY